MREVISAIAIMLVVLCCLHGCGEVQQDNKTAMIRLPDGSVVKGKAEVVAGYSSGIYEVTIDGVKYKTHGTNIVVIYGEE